MYPLKPYYDLLHEVMHQGYDKNDRTGVGTRSRFGAMMQFNLRYGGIPLVQGKHMHIPTLVHELLWIISGRTNIKYLQDNGVTIWNEWADSKGNLGPIYGEQWRSWEAHEVCYDAEYGERIWIDQLELLIDQIKTNPDSRRLLVSAWNVGQLEDMALQPCHVMFQVNVTNGYLNLCMFQRSCDLFLGVPYNIASYSLLVHILAHGCNLKPGEFTHFLGDAHIYKNHFEQVKEFVRNDIMEVGSAWELPKVTIKGPTNIEELRFEHIKIEGYKPGPKIKASVAI